MDERTDAEVLEAARSDPASLEEAYRRHGGAVIRFAARRSRTPEEVVDLSGAVWLEVVSSLDRYDPSRGEPVAWILGIAANLCSAERRRRSREREIVRRLAGRRTLGQDDHERLEEMLDAEAVAPELLRALASLPAAERTAAELVFVDGLSPADATSALGVAGATLRMRLARARRKLRAAALDARDTSRVSAVVTIEEEVR